MLNNLSLKLIIFGAIILALQNQVPVRGGEDPNSMGCFCRGYFIEDETKKLTNEIIRVIAPRDYCKELVGKTKRVKGKKFFIKKCPLD